VKLVLRAPVAAAIAFALAACTGTPALPNRPTAALAHPLARSSAIPIKHVVIIVQENRSFNNLFYGFPGARTAKYGYNSSGKKIALTPLTLATDWDIVHDLDSFFAACNAKKGLPGTHCRMNGFNKESTSCYSSCPPNPEYTYVPHDEIKPYFFMGKQYVLADEMYASNLDASSFISHQYIIAAQADAAVNYPSNSWGCLGTQYYGPDDISTITKVRTYGTAIPVCWNNDTIGAEMDTAGHSWAYYATTVDNEFGGGIWSAYQNISPIFDGPDWSNDVISPQTRFFDDVKAGKLRDLSWITPTFPNSDHAGSDSLTGPAWVASLVNAVGKSKYWNNTAIFIFWDDYGGWFDPAPPKMLDYDGLGFRLPMLVVSAYAKAGYVDHTHYEHGSILKFVEQLFGLPTLAKSDARATAPYNAFDFTKPPRSFQTVPSDYNEEFFKRQPPDHRDPDPG
jgi:phospholipase C